MDVLQPMRLMRTNILMFYLSRRIASSLQDAANPSALQTILCVHSVLTETFLLVVTLGWCILERTYYILLLDIGLTIVAFWECTNAAQPWRKLFFNDVTCVGKWHAGTQCGQRLREDDQRWHQRFSIVVRIILKFLKSRKKILLHRHVIGVNLFKRYASCKILES